MKVLLIHAAGIVACWLFFPGFGFDSTTTAALSALFVLTAYHLGRPLIVLLLLPLSFPLLYAGIKDAPKLVLIGGLWLFMTAAHLLLFWIAQKVFSGFQIAYVWQAVGAAALMGSIYMLALHLMSQKVHP